jgi:two-component system chemotaxis sensor kinase CheA
MSDRLTLSERRIETVKEKLAARLGKEYAEDIGDIMESLAYISLRHWIRQYDEYIDTLCERLEKKVKPVEFTGVDLYMERKVYSGFLRSLVHIFRNIADHGIEHPEEREEGGKDICGSIKADISVEGETAVLTIEDDGAGIDCGKVKRKAVEKGLISAQRAEAMTEEEARELLFLSSFSTKDKTGEVSGRGVGLSAVRAELAAIGGNVRVSGAPGKGTAFILRFPMDSANMEACDVG